MTRHRVVFVNRYFRPDQSATSQMLTDLAQGLPAGSYEVHVVCSRQLYDDPDARLPREERLSGVAIHRLPTTSFGRGRLLGRAIDYASFYIACGFVLWRLLRRGDLVVAKTDPPLISILAALVARARGAVLINWSQDVFPEVASLLGANPLPRWLDRRLRRLRDYSLRAAYVNVMVGSRMFEYFAAREIPLEKLCIIENWADSCSIVPKPSCMSRLRLRLGLGKKFVVCYSGNLGRAHEYAALLGAVAELRADSSVTFLFIGAGARMETLQAAVLAQGLPNARFIPYQPREELEDSLAVADIHLVSLIPSLEGLIVPSKFYGILAAGRPVIFIGDRDGELARVIQETRCGLVVGAGAAGDLVWAIKKLQGNDGLRLGMGVAARNLLAERYSSAQGLASWMAVFVRARAAAHDGAASA